MEADCTLLLTMEAVALFSFTASEADEISFQKGDVIKVSVWMLGFRGFGHLNKLAKVNSNKVERLHVCTVRIMLHVCL